MNTPTSAEPIVAQIRSASSWWQEEAGGGEGGLPGREEAQDPAQKENPASVPRQIRPHLKIIPTLRLWVMPWVHSRMLNSPDKRSIETY